MGASAPDLESVARLRRATESHRSSTERIMGAGNWATEQTNRLLAQRQGKQVPEKPAEPPKPPPKRTFKFHLAIIAVNRQLHSEASLIFHGENSMTFRITAEQPSTFRNSISLTIHDHAKNEPVHLGGHRESIKPAFLKFSHIHLSVVLEKNCFRNRVPWVLRYLVQALNESPARSGHRNVTVVYEDRLLQDDCCCNICGAWPSRCSCPRENCETRGRKASSDESAEPLDLPRGRQ